MSKNAGPPKPKPPYAHTYIPAGKDSVPAGVAKILRIWEDLRTQNRNGYVPGGGLLANIRDHGGVSISNGTTCSPFTATVIGLAFDPEYPRNGQLGHDGDIFVPMFNGGADQLPFLDFYHMHNNDNKPIESVEHFGLGYEIPITQMRRGDLLAIDWNDEHHHGHAVFCWDVHLNGDEVDSFQYLGANSVPDHCGVTIGRCAGPAWLSGKPKQGATAGNLEKARNPMFEDSDDVVRQGEWLALPHIKEGSITKGTFRAAPVRIRYKTPNTFTVNKIRVARLYYQGKPPDPYCMSNGAPPAKAAGHVTVPANVVKGVGVKSDPEAPKKVPPKPASQDKDKPTNWQYEVENALQVFYRAKWIESDPGKPDNINDAKSQAAIREFQKMFSLDVDGIVGKHTLGAVRRQLPACAQQVIAQFLLGSLYRGKKFDHDPGPADGVNNPQMRAAVEQFQKKYSLDATGVPDADTLAKIIEVCRGHEATAAQPGLEPELHHLYWVGNHVEPGGSATLRLHFRDLVIGQECPIHLKGDAGGKEIEASVKLKVEKAQAEVAVPIPAEFGAGAKVHARVVAAISGQGELEATTFGPLYVKAKETGPIAIVKGDDVYLDPPVRLLPQWDPRWGSKAIGRVKSGNLVNWQGNGCNASSAATILRWFAEDCKAGKIPFPTKSGGSIELSWYGLRMGESFWPNMDPPGEVEMVNGQSINFGKIFHVAAHYLKTGEIKRNGQGDAADPSGLKAQYVTKKPAGGWLDLIRKMLKTGPVIVGMKAPTYRGHFVVAQGIVGDALLIVDPGMVLFSAHNGGTKHIKDWQGKEGYLDGTMDKAKVRMPLPAQWPGGKVPGKELNEKSYYHISGQFLKDMLDDLISITSLTYPEGARFDGNAAPQPEATPASESLEVFFKFRGNVGEKNAAKDHTYTAYKVAGKPFAYFLKGRLQVDVDGAPNCYHPQDKDVRKDYLTVDLEGHKGALDNLANGGAPGNWFGVVTDTGEKTGTPIIQGPDDPFPGFYVSSTSLVDKTKPSHDPRRYVDARRIPYIAFPGQVYTAKGPRFTQVSEGPTGEFGDFLTVVNPDADAAHKYCHAVFGDLGGGDDPHFGEGSPALAQRVHAAGVVNAKLLYIIYPHSGGGRYSIPTLEEIQQQGEALFKKWGGMDEVNRVLGMME